MEHETSSQVHELTSSGQTWLPSSLARLAQARRDAAVLKAEQDYAATLAASYNEDFSDLDALGFLSVGGRDKEGRALVCVVAHNYPAKVLQPDRVYRYLATRLDRVVDEPYSVVWFHTRSTYWKNCPSLMWMWRTYERLPPKYRSHLHRLFVVHCDLPLWVALAAVAPACTEALWRKVEWVQRVEFLWDHIPKKQLAVPSFVSEHDSLLEEQPLLDYGVVAAKEVEAVPGMPAPPM